METTFGSMNEKGEVTTHLKVDINTLPSTDPIAFGYGISEGQYYLKNPKAVVDHGSPFKELAPEYLRGFLLGYRNILVKEGTKIKRGQEQNYFFLDQDIRKQLNQK